MIKASNFLLVFGHYSQLKILRLTPENSQDTATAGNNLEANHEAQYNV